MTTPAGTDLDDRGRPVPPGGDRPGSRWRLREDQRVAVNLSCRGLALLLTLALSVMGLGVLSGRVPSDLSSFPFWDPAGPCVVLLEERSPIQVTP